MISTWIMIIIAIGGFGFGFFICALFQVEGKVPRPEPKQPLWRAKEDEDE